MRPKDYGHMMAKSLSNYLLPKFKFQPKSHSNIRNWDIKNLVFLLINGWLMKNMDKVLIVPKWMLISCSKVPQIPPNFICPNYLTKLKSLEFWWKKASLGVHSPWCERRHSFNAKSWNNRWIAWQVSWINYLNQMIRSIFNKMNSIHSFI